MAPSHPLETPQAVPPVAVSGRGALRDALWLLVLLATTATGLEVSVLAEAPEVPGLLGAYAVVGLVYVLAGAWAVWLRPVNRTGLLLCLTGFGVLAAAAGNLPQPVPHSLGEIASEWPLAFFVHLLLAFPSGRLTTLPARALAVATHVCVLGTQVPQVLYDPDPQAPSWLQLTARPDLVERCSQVQTVTVDTLIVLAVAVLVHRLVGAGAGRRRLAALYGYGAFCLAAIVLSARVAAAFDIAAIPLFRFQLVVLTGIPVAFLLAVVSGGFSRTGRLEELAASLGDEPGGGHEMRDAVVRVLGDPSARLLLREAGTTTLLDGAGRVAAPPPPGRHRVVVGPAAEPVGALEYDARLIADPRSVEEVARVVALAVRTEGLSAALEMQATELQRSRARLVEAADNERRRVARDLHDGVQGRLVALAIHAGRVASTSADPDVAREVAQLRDSLQGTVTQLRRLVHGMLPAMLIERGLVSAVAELVDGSAVPVELTAPAGDPRLATAVESAAYFLVAEGLANVAKHADAETVRVRLEQRDGELLVEIDDDGVGGAVGRPGGGIENLSDRVLALGGTLALDSPPGGGTTVRARLPCGS